MTTQDWINEQKIEAVQDRKDGKEYWKTDNLYTESDLIELLEAFALYNGVGQSEQFPSQVEIYQQINKYAFVVPHDGSNNFYDEVALKHYKAGIAWLLGRIRGNGA